MEFCGRCGKELGRGLERGRFCAKCGHENPGNARYPLWAESAEGGAATATLPRVSDDLTSVRLPALSSTTTGHAIAAALGEPASRWRTTVLAALAAITVVLLLGFFLLLR